MKNIKVNHVFLQYEDLFHKVASIFCLILQLEDFAFLIAQLDLPHFDQIWVGFTTSDPATLIFIKSMFDITAFVYL